MIPHLPFLRSGLWVRFATLIALILVACTFKSPQEPVFDVEWFFPLADQTWTMEDLTDDVNELEVDPANDQVLITYEEELNLAFDEQLLQVTLDPGESNKRWYPTDVGITDSIRVRTSGYILQEPSIIDRGVVTFFLINADHDHPVTTRLILLDLFEPDGVTHPTFELTVPPAAPDKDMNYIPIQIDLAGYTLDATRSGADNFFRIAIRTQGAVPDYQAGIAVSYSYRSFILRSITGRFEPIQAIFADVEIDDPIPEEFKDIQFQNVQVLIPFHATVCVPFKFLLHIRAINPRNNPVDPLFISKVYDPAPCQAGLVDTLTIDNAADFINSNPEKIAISGLVELGDPTSTTTIGVEDTLYAKAIFKAPLIVKLPVDTTRTTVDTLEIDSDTQDLVRDNLNALALTAEIDNHTPLAVTVTLLFSETRGDSTLYDHPPDLVIGPVELAQATLDGDPAIVTQAASATWTQNLTKSQMDLFARNDSLYMGTEIVYLSAASRMVRIRPSDYFRVVSYLKASLSSKIPEDD